MFLAKGSCCFGVRYSAVVHQPSQCDQGSELRWTSADVDNPQWIELGFPHEIDFSGIIIKWFSNNTRARSVQIYLSMDGEVWTEVNYTKETLSPGYIDQFTFPNQTAQHLRIVMADPAGLTYSVSSVEIPGIEFDFPFYLQAGYGSGQGEAYLESEGERVGLDVLHIWYSNTFTRGWDIKQEYYLAKVMVNYRDWVEQVIGQHGSDISFVGFRRAVSARRFRNRNRTASGWLPAMPGKTSGSLVLVQVIMIWCGLYGPGRTGRMLADVWRCRHDRAKHDSIPIIQRRTVHRTSRWHLPPSCPRKPAYI